MTKIDETSGQLGWFTHGGLTSPFAQDKKGRILFKLDESQLLDYFAAKAMQKIAYNLPTRCRLEVLEQIARDAYDIAEAMLKERERREREG